MPLEGGTPRERSSPIASHRIGRVLIRLVSMDRCWRGCFEQLNQLPVYSFAMEMNTIDTGLQHARVPAGTTEHRAARSCRSSSVLCHMCAGGAGIQVGESNKMQQDKIVESKV